MARAPGRVNLIGDHTDYTGGLVLPMAIDLATTVEFERGVPWIELVSSTESDPAFVDLDHLAEPRLLRPHWARYVAAVAAVIRPERGGAGYVTTTLPVGAGLSSSAALEVAVALALGFEGEPVALALACQQAEQLASGVPCGVMDQLVSVLGVEGSALLIDCTSLEVTPVPVPDHVDVVVIDSGQRRSLASSSYGVRHAQCEEAAALVGSLRAASLDDVEVIAHDDLRRRARHVVTENARVRSFAESLADDDLTSAGVLMRESHMSLRDDFEVSTRLIDGLVDALVSTPGVYGARMTGGGFGGCVVALTVPDTDLPVDGWRLRPAAGATLEMLD